MFCRLSFFFCIFFHKLYSMFFFFVFFRKKTLAADWLWICKYNIEKTKAHCEISEFPYMSCKGFCSCGRLTLRRGSWHLPVVSRRSLFIGIRVGRSPELHVTPPLKAFPWLWLTLRRYGSSVVSLKLSPHYSGVQLNLWFPVCF